MSLLSQACSYQAISGWDIQDFLSRLAVRSDSEHSLHVAGEVSHVRKVSFKHANTRSPDPNCIIPALSRMSKAIRRKVISFNLILGRVVFCHDEPRTPLFQIEAQKNFVVHAFGINGKHAKLERYPLLCQNGIQTGHAH